MTPLPLHERINNSQQLLRLMKETPQHRFTRGLVAWSSKGTFWQQVASAFTSKPICCIGGHVARDKYFQQLGVKRAASGAPFIAKIVKDSDGRPTFKRLGDVAVAEHLFGDETIFMPALSDEIQRAGGLKNACIARAKANLDLLLKAQRDAQAMIATLQKAALQDMSVKQFSCENQAQRM